MHTALFTPRLDDRYGEGQITSRIGLQDPPWLLNLILISSRT